MAVKNCFIFMLLVFLISSVSAILDVQIDVAEKFNYGENVSYRYLLSPHTSMNISYLANVLCEGEEHTQSLLKLENVSLKSRELFYSIFYFGPVDEFSGIVECKAVILIFEPIKASFEKPFQIVSKGIFAVEIYSCKDSSCLKKSSSFIKGDKIYLDYYTASDGVLLSNFQLKYPSGNIKLITLPYNFNSPEIGTYELTASATKEEYKNLELFYSFSIIEEAPDIKLLNFSNYPVDEPPNEKIIRESGLELKKDSESESTKKFSSMIWIAVSIFVLFLFLTIALIVYFKRKNKIGQISKTFKS